MINEHPAQCVKLQTVLPFAVRSVLPPKRLGNATGGIFSSTPTA